MRLRIGKQLALGFGLMIALIVISAIVAYAAVANMKQNVTRVVDEAFPAVLACDALTSGLNHSLASLRGYIILGADEDEAARFSNERDAAWVKINAAMRELDDLRHVWTQRGIENNLRAIREKVAQLDTVQKNVEDNAFAENNIAAYHLLHTEAEPKTRGMDKALATIIGEEGTLEATVDRKEFLTVMSETRGTLAVALTTLRAYVDSGSPELKQRFDDQWKRHREAYEQAPRVLRRMTDAQRAQWEQFDDLHMEFDSLPGQLLQLRDADDWNKAHFQLQKQAIPLAGEISTAVDNLKQSANRRVEDDRGELAAAITTLTIALFLAALLATAIGGTLAFVIGRSVVAVIKGTVDLVASTAAQMSVTADQQLEMTQQQAAAVNEVTTTLEQLTRSSESSAQQAEQALNQTGYVLGLADDGTNTVNQSIAGMASLNEKVNDIAQQIVQLSDQNSQISEITVLVRDLAKRTNVLALNASVEAAQAGEQGAGFAVVAGEIRKLAEESAQSAEQIRTIVEQVQKSTNSTVMATEEGTKTLKTGTALAEQTNAAFHDVAGSVGGVVEGIQMISLSAKEQAFAVSHVGTAMDEINRGAREIELQASNTKHGVIQMTQAVDQLREII